VQRGYGACPFIMALGRNYAQTISVSSHGGQGGGIGLRSHRKIQGWFR
jgi:hypothetical protein